jgi:thiol:disulfide interchange protein
MTKKVFVIFLIILVGGFIAIEIVGSSHQKTAIQPKKDLASINQPLVPAVFTNLQGQSVSLASYRNKKLMVYLLATWCSSCQASLQTLLSNAPTLQKDGLNIVTLETYGDAGYSGPSMQQFISGITNAKSPPTNFIFGDASKSLTTSYNPKNTPDIYYLINPKGVIQTVNSTPSATMNSILKFARTA